MSNRDARCSNRTAACDSVAQKVVKQRRRDTAICKKVVYTVQFPKRAECKHLSNCFGTCAAETRKLIPPLVKLKGGRYSLSLLRGNISERREFAHAQKLPFLSREKQEIPAGSRVIQSAHAHPRTDMRRRGCHPTKFTHT